MPDAEEEYALTTSKVAAILGCNPSTVWRYAEAGDLPYLMTEGGVRADGSRRRGRRMYRRSDVKKLRGVLAQPDRRRSLEERLDEVAAEVAELQRQLRERHDPPTQEDHQS